MNMVLGGMARVYGIAAVFTAIVVLFNPIFPVELVSWQFLWVYSISLATASLFLGLLKFQLRPRLSIPSITDRTPGSQSL